VTQISEWQQRIRKINELCGWFDQEVTFATAMANLHGEVSEAWEAWRKWGGADATDNIAGQINEAIPKPEGVGSEFADILIRLLDDCERWNIDLTYEVERKLAFNVTRSYRHGGKLA
jgi:NTP pyrophosphatase (non-canonical NTP hydrolase)